MTSHSAVSFCIVVVFIKRSIQSRDGITSDVVRSFRNLKYEKIASHMKMRPLSAKEGCCSVLQASALSLHTDALEEALLMQKLCWKACGWFEITSNKLLLSRIFILSLSFVVSFSLQPICNTTATAVMGSLVMIAMSRHQEMSETMMAMRNLVVWRRRLQCQRDGETMRMTTQYCDDNGDDDDNNDDYLAALIIILKNLETVGVVSLGIIVIIAWFSAASERHDQKSNQCEVLQSNNLFSIYFSSNNNIRR